MGPPPGDYDDRYLAGAVLFNRGDYFGAHEVWEDLWMDCPAADRRFYQSLIQAAVALYHWGNGNRAGAARLFHSGRRYMDPYRPARHGLDVDRFWRQVEAALAPALASPLGPGDRGGSVGIGPDSVLGTQYSVLPAPRIDLDPPPAAWPDPVPEHTPQPGGGRHD